MTWLYKNNKSNILLIKNKYKLLKKKRHYILNFKNKVIKNKKIFFKNIQSLNIKEESNNYITKICVFLGRKKNMIILHKYIELGLQETILNEYHMFDFSRNIQDHIFIKEEYNRLINIYPHQSTMEGGFSFFVKIIFYQFRLFLYKNLS